MAFIERKEFDSKYQEQQEENKILNWKEIQVDEVFKIIFLEEIKTKFGFCFIITAEDQKKYSFRFFSPNGLYKSLKKNLEEKKEVYFVSHGQELDLLLNRTRNKFDVLYIDGENKINQMYSKGYEH